MLVQHEWGLSENFTIVSYSKDLVNLLTYYRFASRPLDSQLQTYICYSKKQGWENGPQDCVLRR